MSWKLLSNPPKKTGRYIVGHRGYAEIIHYLHPDGEWHHTAKIGWQKDPTKFKATHYMPLKDIPPGFKAKLELAVHGYRVSTFECSGGTLKELIDTIWVEIRKLHKELVEADKRNGDLRGYTPEFANGYPSLGGLDPELNSDTSLSIFALYQDDEQLDYHSKHFKALRVAFFGE